MSHDWKYGIAAILAAIALGIGMHIQGQQLPRGLCTPTTELGWQQASEKSAVVAKGDRYNQ